MDGWDLATVGLYLVLFLAYGRLSYRQGLTDGRLGRDRATVEASPARFRLRPIAYRR